MSTKAALGLGMLGMRCCDRIVQLILCRLFRLVMSLAIPRQASDDFCRCSRTLLICPVLAADSDPSLQKEILGSAALSVRLLLYDECS